MISGNYALTSLSNAGETDYRNNLTNATSLIKKLKMRLIFSICFCMRYRPLQWNVPGSFPLALAQGGLTSSTIEKSIGKFKIWLPICVQEASFFHDDLLSELKLMDKVSVIGIITEQ